MNVGIDITATVYGRGVSRYTSNLAKSLLRHTNLSLHLFGVQWGQYQSLQKMAARIEKEAQFLGQAQHSLVRCPPKVMGTAWNFGLIPVRKWLPSSTKVFHSWDWQQPPDKSLSLVSTIHDLAILKYPEVAKPEVLAAHQRSWKILKKRQAEIIAVSRTTAQDIMNYLDISENHITVVYESLPEEFRSAADSLSPEVERHLIHKYQLNQPYLFFVGTREPRKNLANLIRAWQPLASEVRLLIAGESGWDLSSEIPGPKPEFLGKVTDSALVTLYKHAKALTYPCLDEGFGLPILEAFYLKTPVLTSNRSAMKEVAGNAAHLVEPDSVESIQAGIESVLHESGELLQARKQRMKIRLHQFDWKTTALETAEVYEKAFRKR